MFTGSGDLVKAEKKPRMLGSNAAAMLSNRLALIVLEHRGSIRRNGREVHVTPVDEFCPASASPAPCRKKANGGSSHDQCGGPAHDLQTHMQGEIAHCGPVAGQVHHHRHDRYRDEAVDHRTPEQGLDRINRAEVQHHANQRCQRDGTVERLGLPGFTRQSDIPAEHLTHGIG